MWTGAFSLSGGQPYCCCLRSTQGFSFRNDKSFGNYWIHLAIFMQCYLPRPLVPALVCAYGKHSRSGNVAQSSKTNANKCQNELIIFSWYGIMCDGLCSIHE